MPSRPTPADPDAPMLKTLHDTTEAPLEPLLSKRVAVLGFGSQGSAHALNLRESGVEVTVANRADSASGRRARDAGFAPVTIPEAVAEADLVIIALPDEVQGAVFTDQIAPHLRAGSVLGFIHGYAIRYGEIVPPDDAGVVLVAPKGPGSLVRDLFVSGRGLPCLFAVHQESERREAEPLGLAWATGIGASRAAIIRTTFADETETDLFGEQAVLCGGVMQLILAAFETLVDAGYEPELAYLECCQELKQIADLIYADGLAATMRRISNTAEFGAYRAGPTVIDDAARERLRKLLADIRNGTFAKALGDDRDHGYEWFRKEQARLREHPIETAGSFVRSLMPWLAGSGAKRASP